MTTIALPKTVESAFIKATDTKTSTDQLERFLKTEAVLTALIDHRKTFTNVSNDEYRSTLQELLSSYRPGQAVGAQELAKTTSDTLAALIEDRQISQTQIKESFIPLLRDIQVIEGEGRLIWAYLDTPSQLDKFKQRTASTYHAYISTTPHEAKLKHSLRDHTALRKLEAVVLDSRKLQEDVGNELEFLKREDRKHRELAHELGIPYSQIKDEAMKKRKKSSSVEFKTVAFPLAIAAMVVFGFYMAPSDSNDVIAEEAYSASSEQFTSEYVAPVANTSAQQYGLSEGEYVWRQRYIALYVENNGGGSQEMEDEMFNMAAEHMISRSRMDAIVKTITAAEVTL